MIKGFKLMAAVMLVGAMLLVASSASATPTVVFNGAGSSAAFNVMAEGAEATATPPCGLNNWTKSKGAQGIDNRTGGGTPVTGNIWIVWNGAADGSTATTVCSYLSIDSVVGVRLYFSTPASTLSILSAAGTSGDNLICNGAAGCAIFPADVAAGLPQAIINALQGQAFNAAPSDVRPEDAAVESQRVLAGAFSNCKNLGYTGGTLITSAFGGASVQPVAFNIVGTDPLSGSAVATFATTNLGAQVEVVFVNTTQTGDGHFGNSQFTNVDRFSLSGALDGTFNRTRDLIPGSGGAVTQVPMTVLTREPLSGTYTTMEFSIPRSAEIGSCQENNVNPLGAPPTGWTGTTDPLNMTFTKTSGKRMRVVGTGEMVHCVVADSKCSNAVNNPNPDTIGYAFWSYANLSAAASAGAKYLTVDGVDPLQASYSGGAIPTCPTLPCAPLAFTNVLNGSYSIWNVLRVITAKPVPAGISSLITATESIATSADFVPIGSLQVFRSHFNVTVNNNGSGGTQLISAHNGHTSAAEAGGDVGGAVYSIQADLDNNTDTKKELTGKKQ